MGSGRPEDVWTLGETIPPERRNLVDEAGAGEQVRRVTNDVTLRIAANEIFSTHRVWFIQWPSQAEAPPMVAIQPRLTEPEASCETPQEEADGHLVFCDGARWRSPTAVVLGAAGSEVRVRLSWNKAPAVVKPLTLAGAMEVPTFKAFFGLDGLDPADPECEAIFDMMFPR